MTFFKNIMLNQSREVRPAVVTILVVLVATVLLFSILQMSLLVMSAFDISAPVWLGDFLDFIKNQISDYFYGR